jgi:hypothetical protein
MQSADFAGIRLNGALPNLACASLHGVTPSGIRNRQYDTPKEDLLMPVGANCDPSRRKCSIMYLRLLPPRTELRCLTPP